jgi:hypothetical protein
MSAGRTALVRAAALLYASASALEMAFQVALAFGAPWGAYAMGGQVTGALPPAPAIGIRGRQRGILSTRDRPLMRTVGDRTPVGVDCTRRANQSHPGTQTVALGDRIDRTPVS